MNAVTKEEAWADFGMRYLIDGEVKFMSHEERLSIEASGICSLEHYAMTPDADAIYVSFRDLLNAMDARPGAVAYGERPAQSKHRPVAPHRQREPRTKNEEVWHLLPIERRSASETVCGQPGTTGWVFGFTRFGRLINMPKICAECRAHWNAEVLSGSPRSKQ